MGEMLKAELIRDLSCVAVALVVIVLLDFGHWVLVRRRRRG